MKELTSISSLCFTQRTTRPSNPKAAAGEQAVHRLADLEDLRRLVAAAESEGWLEGGGGDPLDKVEGGGEADKGKTRGGYACVQNKEERGRAQSSVTCSGRFRG